MKKQVSDIVKSLFVAGIMLITSGITFGQNADKEIAKDYKIDKGFTLAIDNEYGEINLVNWDKNELSVIVRIETEAASQAKAEELLEKVSIAIEESNSNASFDTEIDKKVMNGKNKIKVTYSVKAPAYLNVNLEQAYGNIYIQDLTGIAELEVRYGNLTANALENKNAEQENSLDLAYGNASIESVISLTADIKYSELSLTKSKDLNNESAYSKLQLGVLSNLDIESKYDKLSIGELNGSVNIESGYTQVNLGTLNKGFKEVVADVVYGNIKGSLGEGVSFSIDANAAYGSIDIPDGDYNTQKEGTSQTVNGKIGSGSGGNLVVKVKYGNLSLK